jgi:hypothetical protein
MKHKWHKEIKAWADGAEIEVLSNNDTWGVQKNPTFAKECEYRIKPQPIQEYLDYNPDTGIFIWKKSPSKKVKEGSIAGFMQNGYVAITFNGELQYAHRLAWLFIYGKFPDNVIDHINGIKTDNRIDNLRDVTYAVNNQNQKKGHFDSKSGKLGVSWNSSKNKWVAKIGLNGKQRHLGYFDDVDEANDIYQKAKNLYHDIPPKEPQYLYVYDTEEGIKLGAEGSATPIKNLNGRYKLLGAIKMEEQS